MVGIIAEFLEFLKEYKVVALAVAFIMGVAATTLIKSLVDNIIMPFIGILVPSGDWKAATLNLGPVHLGIGPFFADCINFIVVGMVIFMIAKVVLREEKVEKK